MLTYIVTGTTRGLGQALIQVIQEAGDRALSLSTAPDYCDGDRCNVQSDLADTDSLPAKLDLLLELDGILASEALVMINNAGRLDPIMPIQRAAPGQIAKAVAVNLVAPAVLMAHFLFRTQKLTLPRRIINISSGAAARPYAGWAAYCSTKSGLNMLTRCVAQEQEAHPNPALVCTVAPGVINTRMQRQIRSVAEENFPAKQKFVRLHTEGVLATPRSVAHHLLRLDRQGRFEQGGCHDLREMSTSIKM
ncbi:MAG: SDR family NAD(P)-dependent oxidoreductase [Desulfosarcinaceae bacterium]|nr:SDR family NAD(P)-dependent oxidoreductase [Desulfosarcinaceae bacterium]